MRRVAFVSVGRATAFGGVVSATLAPNTVARRWCVAHRIAKGIMDPPAVIDSSTTVVNYLMTMKREHQVHRMSATVERVRENVRQLIVKLPTDASRWLTLESALVLVSTCSYFGLRYTDHLGLVRALTFLADALEDGQQVLSLEFICRIALAAAGIHVLEGKTTGCKQRADGPLRRILESAPPRLAKTLSTRIHPQATPDEPCPQPQPLISALEASLCISASHKLRQAVGPGPVLEAYAIFKIDLHDVALLLNVLLQSSFARDQLISVLTNVVSSDTLQCFINGPLIHHGAALDTAMESMASAVRGLWFAVLDIDNARYGGKHKMKSYHCTSLMGIAGRLCIAVARITEAGRPGSSAALHTCCQRGDMLTQLAAAIARVESNAASSQHLMVSASNVELLLHVATGSLMHFSAGEHSVLLNGLSKVYETCVLGRMDSSASSSPTMDGSEGHPRHARNAGNKAARFKRRGQQADQPEAGANHILTQAPLVPALNAQQTFRFFVAEKDDDVEFESMMLSFVERTLNWLCIRRTIHSKQSSMNNSNIGRQYTLKELAMLRQALNVFGVPCDFLDWGIMGRLAAPHDGFSTSAKTHYDPLEAVRAVVPLLQAPQRNTSAISAVKVLHYVAECVGPAIDAVQRSYSTPASGTTGDQGVGHSDVVVQQQQHTSLSAGDVVELLHALVCDGGLTRTRGVYRSLVVQCVLRADAAASAGQLRPVHSMLLGEALIGYLADGSIAPPGPSSGSGDDEALCLRVLVATVSSVVGPAEGDVGTLAAMFDDVQVLRQWPTFADAVGRALSSDHNAWSMCLAQAWSGGAGALQHRVRALSGAAAGCMRCLDMGLLARGSAFNRRFAEWCRQYLWFDAAFQAKLAASLRTFRWPSTMLSVAVLAEGISWPSVADSSAHPYAQLDECWSSSRTSVRSFGQLATLVTLVHQLVPDAVHRPSAATALESLIVRKTDHVLLRTGRPEDVVRLLQCIGPNDRLCSSVIAVIERDAAAMADTFVEAIVPTQRMLGALLALHPSVRLRAMHATAFLAKYAVLHSVRLDDIMAVLLEYGHAGSDALVDVARAIPHALIASPREPLNSALVVKMLEFFRVGRQPYAVRKLRALFGTVLTSTSNLFRMPFSDVVKLVDVPEREREGRFWNICRRALFTRVRLELETWCSTVSAGDGVPVVLPDALRSLSWEHWAIVFCYAPRDRNTVVPTSLLLAQQQAEKRSAAQHRNRNGPDDAGEEDHDHVVEPVRRGLTRDGAALLMYLAAQHGGTSEAVLALLRSLNAGDLVQLVEAITCHWDTIPLRPKVDGIMPAGCAMDVVRSWVEQWEPSASDGDDEVVRAKELRLFEPLFDFMCSCVLQPEQPLDGGCVVRVLTCCSHWKDVSLIVHLDETIRSQVALRTSSPDGTKPRGDGCVRNVHLLISWCQEEIRVLAVERAWMQDGSCDATVSQRRAVQSVDGGDAVAHLSTEERFWSMVGGLLRLQWADMESDLRWTTAYALGALTAHAACTLWLQVRWYAASRQTTGDAVAAWCEQLQAALLHQIGLLLQSADGRTVAAMVALLLPDSSGARSVVDQPIVGVLTKVPVLMANDLDNFTTADVVSIVPRLALAGYLPQQSLDAMVLLCEGSLREGEANNSGSIDDCSPRWVPLVRDGRHANNAHDFKEALATLKQYRPLATASSLQLDNI